jgi:hypothetical protein
METIQLKINGMTCGSCVNSVSQVLDVCCAHPKNHFTTLSILTFTPLVPGLMVALWP